MRAAIIIPTYNHAASLTRVITGCRSLQLPIIVVDDGSTDDTATILEKIRGITVLRHEKNMGKGAALLTGFGLAMQGSDWAITLDADGQHDPEDCHQLLAAIPPTGRPLIIGVRQGMQHNHVPWTSRFGRGFSNFWVRVSGGPRVSDSQSGFRLYPLPEVLKLPVIAQRYQYEVEVLVHAGMIGMPVLEIPVQVIYQGKERVSHFRPVVDFLRNSATFSRLIMTRILHCLRNP